MVCASLLCTGVYSHGLVHLTVQQQSGNVSIPSWCPATWTLLLRGIQQSHAMLCRQCVLHMVLMMTVPTSADICIALSQGSSVPNRRVASPATGWSRNAIHSQLYHVFNSGRSRNARTRCPARPYALSWSAADVTLVGVALLSSCAVCNFAETLLLIATDWTVSNTSSAALSGGFRGPGNVTQRRPAPTSFCCSDAWWLLFTTACSKWAASDAVISGCLDVPRTLTHVSQLRNVRGRSSQEALHRDCHGWSRAVCLISRRQQSLRVSQGAFARSIIFVSVDCRMR